MQGFVIQPWTTLRASQTSSGLIQSASAWCDLGEFEDLAVYTDVREVSGSPTMTFETAPVPEDAAFVAMIAGFTVTTGVRVDKLIASVSSVRIPPARFVRWRMSGGGVWDITFRILAAAYALA